MTRPRFKLSARGAALAMISAAFATQASANTAGRIDFVFGEASVRAADGRLRPAAKGELVQDGDTLVTGNGRAQVRFTDGAYVSLQPNTEFGVREYRYEGKTDGSERGFFSLVRGAMRTVTGAIGRYNRSAYQVRTPTATVGIRGTGGLIAVLPDLSTLIKGTSGTWLLSNPAGQIEVPAGTSGLATPDIKAPPQQTSQSPEAPPPPPPVKEATYSEGEKTTETGDACSVTQNCSPGTSAPPPPPILQSGGGYTSSVAYCCTFSSPQMVPLSGATATFDSAGRMTNIADGGGQEFHADPDVAKIVNFGNDGLIAWGRWTGNVTGFASIDGLNAVSENYSSNQGLHYVIGMPTLSMPTTGSARYDLIGATQPTYTDGRTAPGTFTGFLSVTFSAAPSLTGNFNVAMPDGKRYAMSGTTTTAGSSFQLPMSVAGSGGACTSGCASLASGFFAGTAAERAGLTYSITDFTAVSEILGAAAFKKP